MTLQSSKKIADKPAAAVSKGLEFTAPASALCAKDDSARAWLEKLAKTALYEDAIKLLAAALPKRECVHWALACSREAVAKAAPPAHHAALDAAAKWTADPSDVNRRAAGAASELAKLDTAAGCTALSAFMSGGSLAPVGLTPVPPAEHLCALCAAVAIQLAAQLEGPLKSAGHLKRFFELGIKLASEPAPWEAPAPAPARPAAAPKPR